MRIRLFLIVLICTSVQVFAQEEWPLKALNDRRFTENWQLTDWSLRESSSRNFSDRIKAISISKDNKIWFSSGGQLRVRYMGTINDEFKDTNTGLFTIRARLFGAINFGKNFRVFAEGIYSNTTNDNSERKGAGTPVVNGALLNLFAEYTLPLGAEYDAQFWVGRRELQAGHERLVSPGNWLNTRRSWDGAGFSVGNNKGRMIGFWTKPVIVVPDGYTTRDEETDFWGIRYQSDEVVYSPTAGFGVQSWSAYSTMHFEPYFYGLHRKNVLFEQGRRTENRYTLGALLSGPLQNGFFNYEFEGAYQFGRFGNNDLSAYSITAEFGVNPNLAWSPHFWVGLDYASGDSDPNDDKLGTFDPMYAQVAAWFGEHGVIDRKNLVSYSFNIDFSPHKFITSRFTYWNFNRAQTADAVYDTANGILRPASGSLQKDLGNSFQLSNVIKPTYQLEFTLTYNLWAPGKFFDETQTGNALTQHFIMITSQYTF